MITIIIPQKISGTGTIHDLASEHFDRLIKFRSNEHYAVVIASYYGNGNLYTCHRTREAAIKASNRNREYSHMILDDQDNWYSCDGYQLIPSDHPPAQRRSQRYGKLVRGWDWRTTPERLEKAKQVAKKLGISKTELIERALDSFIESHFSAIYSD